MTNKHTKEEIHSIKQLNKEQKLTLERAVSLIEHLFKIGQIEGKKPTREEMEKEFLSQLDSETKKERVLRAPVEMIEADEKVFRDTEEKEVLITYKNKIDTKKLKINLFYTLLAFLFGYLISHFQLISGYISGIIGVSLLEWKEVNKTIVLDHDGDVYSINGEPAGKYKMYNEKMEEKARHKPFLILTKIDKEGYYHVFLANPSNQTYKGVKKLTGAFASAGNGEDLLETSKAVFTLPDIQPHTSVEIDNIEWRERDFIVWYQLDFITEDGTWNYLKGSVGKSYYYSDKDIQTFDEYDKEGWLLDLSVREDNKSIDEVIKTMNMESRYITYDEKK